MSELTTILPELALLTAACVVLLVDVYRGAASPDVTFFATILGLLVALGCTVAVFPESPQVAFAGNVIHDPMSVVLRALILAFGVFMFAYGRDYFARTSTLKGEYFVLGMLALLGAMLITVGGNLLLLYLGLELLSLSMYALVALERDSSSASEAAIKYFVLGALASGLLLYGMSMIYGATGSLDLGVIAQTIRAGAGSEGALANPQVLSFGMVFIVIGLAFKLGVVPFHMWVPDVYEGAPTPVTLFIGSIPKLAAFALAFRLLGQGLGPMADQWQSILYALAVLSMVLGNLVAIAQTNIKRMLAYSTISHMGFLLIGFLAATGAGYASAMFYAVVYALTSLAAFAFVILISHRGREGDRIVDFAGLGRRAPWFGFLAIVVFFSLAGVPPFPGFWAKWFVLKETVDSGFMNLAVIAVLSSVVGAFYYLNLLKVMFFDEPAPDTPVVGAGADFRLVLSVNSLLLLALGLLPGLLMQVCVNVLAP